MKLPKFAKERIRLERLEKSLNEGTINRIKDRVYEAWIKGLERGFIYGIGSSYAIDEIFKYKLDNTLDGSLTIPLYVITTFALMSIVGRAAEANELNKAIDEKSKIFPEDVCAFNEWKRLYIKQTRVF